MSAKVRIVLCDDHPIFLAGLRTLIEAEKDFELVGDAANGLDGLRLIEQEKPDVAVIDISMPKLNGILLARKLASENPPIRVVILTLYEDRVYALQAMESGARAYVLKRSAAEHLIRAIRTVLGGGIYLDPAIAGVMIPKTAEARPAQPVSSADRAVTTTREAAVLKMVAKGYANKEIARKLEIGVKSVETYKARGFEKLGLKTRVDLVRYATMHGWLTEV